MKCAIVTLKRVEKVKGFTTQVFRRGAAHWITFKELKKKIKNFKNKESMLSSRNRFYLNALFQFTRGRNLSQVLYS